MIHNLADVAQRLSRHDINVANDQDAFLLLMTEIGELAKAMAHEDEVQVKNDVNEDSSGEAFDVALTALALFFRRGGTHAYLDELIATKGQKWANAIGARTETIFPSPIL